MMGTFGLAAAIAEGAEAGRKAAAMAGFDKKTKDVAAPEAAGERAYSVLPVWAPPAKGKGKAFVDFQTDVTMKDIETAHQEGYRSVEHLKRYTTLGMGTDQGKTSNINAIGLMAGRGISPEAGTTTFRPL
jgi:sarcosine oxidase subunit alpha